MLSRFARYTLVFAVSFTEVVVLAQAAPSTSRGQISVAQVIQMLDKAPADRVAEQVLTAYLAGVGEAAGIAVDIGRASCAKTLNLTADHVRQAVRTAAGKPDAAEVAATPLIVRDMLERAKCKRSAT